MKPHTTHHVCPEQLAKYGGQTVGCCCSGHNCKPDPATRYEEQEFTYRSAVVFFATGFVAFILTLIIILLIKGI